MKRFQNNNNPSKRPQRRGVAAVMTVIIIAVLLGFAALSVDVGYMYDTTAHSQNSADAASLAGALAIWEENNIDALPLARNVLLRNLRTRGWSDVGQSVFQIGWWDSATQTFIVGDPADPSGSNAVRVVAARNDVPLFFAAIFGKKKTRIVREAIAQSGIPCGGIWGLESVRVPGSVEIDSYDSEAGPYSALTAGADGDLCSGGPITVSGSAIVEGDAIAGLGEDVTLNGGTVDVTGVLGSQTGAIDVPTADFGDILVNNDNNLIGLTDDGDSPYSSGYNVRMNADDNLTLPPGTKDDPNRYYFDSMRFTSGSTLTITGPTIIYLAGNLDFTGQGTINTTLDPADLMIISTGSLIRMTGGVAFYGSILAPFADIELSGTSEYYGAVIGKTVKISGDFEFHVDDRSPLVGLIPTPPPILVK